MRVAHLIWSFTTGGIETMLIDIVNEQVKTCDVLILIINDKYDPNLIKLINKKVKIKTIKRPPGDKTLYYILSLNIKLLLFRPDIIHCHQGNIAKIIWIPAKKVLTIHNTHSTTTGYSRYQSLFCISKAVKDYTAKQGFPNGIVVYNGIHTDAISVKDYSEISDRNHIRIVCVGRLHPDKGQRVLIDALNILINNRKVSGLSVDFVGDGVDRKFLEDYVLVYHLVGYVNFLGSKSRSWLYSRLKDYDLLVLPSISEGFGLTLAEGCAAKLSVLSCDLKGPLEVLDGGRLGLTFKTGDADSFADKIEDFANSEINMQTIEEAFTFVKNNFDVKMTSENYIKGYKSVLKC